MSSKLPNYHEAYVWVWLPRTTEPVVAGRLSAESGLVHFNYGKSYLEREDALPLYLPELPLKPGELPLHDGLTMPSSIRDAAPDAWGRRVILNRKFGVKGNELGNLELSELTFLLESGSDRIGALDFQISPNQYVPRSPTNATLEELMASAERVEKGIPLSPELDQALHHGSSIGGARPKALIEDGAIKHVAKFSSSSDFYSVVKAEYVAMRLAARCGLDVAPVSLVSASGKDVLLVERFDRVKAEAGWQRKMMVSALTMLGLDEMMARYASYADLADIIRHRFTEPKATLRELFARIVFNILSGNTDDHARNHAAFCNGEMLSLTPAYDICPQGRAGQEATQAMLITHNNRASRVATCFESAHHFLLSQNEAMQIVEVQLRCITEHWAAVCNEADLSETERNFFWGRQFLNPYAFTALEGASDAIRKLADQLRKFVASNF
ncbi:type II toxin-antitoxin system HipA family toxin [Pseudomarimonas arenosa]|uniref:HipA domain-containing protein n=1 Tax=Pseudomarimonas arenosa TaxID=2774145 RepID=A0AAW3ZNG0_9GAMM|nr:HipA domain-containing protein [Pseudomarimonas arenosa]MBD8527074.1 HipA domain-containing protein [Pseudomarimonas arenosa]